MIAIPVKSKTYGEKLFFIDGEDFERIKNYTWCLSKNYYNNDFYIVSSIQDSKTKKTKYVNLQRLLTNCPDDKIVDHINKNTLDNRQENLRICNKSENARNMKKPSHGKSSIYKGVRYKKERNKFHSYIFVNKKQIFLGYFDSEKDAALKYNEAAIKYFGNFALLNEVADETK